MENEIIFYNPREEEEEIWKICSDYPAYEVSNYGRVRNKATQKLMKPNYKNNGKYAQVHLRIGVKGKHGKTITVHRLVAKEFLNPPENDEQIVLDHIDRNKQNNFYKNLRWVSYSENRANSKEPGKRIYITKTPIVLVDKNTNELIKSYKNPLEASKDLDISAFYIKRNIHNALDYAFGKFMLAEEYFQKNI